MDSISELEGVWEPVLYRSLDGTTSEYERKATGKLPWTLVIKSGRFNVTAGEYVAAQGKISIDATSELGKVDFVYLDGNAVLGVQRAIYALNDDDLILVSAGLNLDRPRGLELDACRRDIVFASYKRSHA